MTQTSHSKIAYTKSLHFTNLDKTIFVSSGREYITFWNISNPTNPELHTQYALEDINGRWSTWTPTSGPIIFHYSKKYFFVQVFGIKEIGLETNFFIFNYSNYSNLTLVNYTLPEHPLFEMEHFSPRKYFDNDDSIWIMATISPPYRYYIANFVWTNPLTLTLDANIIYNTTDYFDLIGLLAFDKQNQRLLSYYNYAPHASFLIDLQTGALLTEPNTNPDTVVQSTVTPIFLDDYIICLDTIRAASNPGFGPIRVWQIKLYSSSNNSVWGKYKALILSSSLVILLTPIIVLVIRKIKNN
jgi:hypothetical protein